MKFLNDDTLIGDGGIIIPQKESPVWSWTLADWIENIKSWPDGDDQVKKYGHQKVNQLLRENLYQGLAIHMKYHLLHQRELDSLVHSEPLLDLMPHVNLMLTSHNFITHHCWPRIRWLWNWIPDADFLWGLFEYSLCYNNLKKIIEGTNIASKNALLAKLGEIVQRKQAWLEDPGCPQKEILSSAIRDVVAHTARYAEEKGNSFQAWEEFFAEIKNDLLSNIYRLILVQADIHICLHDDFSLINPYQTYMDSWDSYREQMSHNNKFQVLRLESPDYDPVFSGKVGRPRKAKEHTQKRGRGRPPKGQGFQSNL